jgi:ABC-type transport system involved in multi-copper enzyme maturation permease subunit
MFWIILRREFFDQLYSAKFAIGVILCLTLVSVSTYVSVKDYERRLLEYQMAEEERIKSREIHPDEYWVVYRKPEVMSIISNGYDKKIGNEVRVYHAYQLRPTGYGEAIRSQNGAISATGFASIDFSSVVRLFLSLLALFLAYDTVSGERESGTLRLVFSNPVKRSMFLFGKFLGGVFCLLIPLTISLLFLLLFLQFSPLVQFSKSEYLRVFLLFIVSAFYIMAWFALGMLVSSLTHHSSVSLLFLLVGWVFLLIIVPNVSIAFVQRISKVPSFDTLEKKYEAVKFEKEEEYLQAGLFYKLYKIDQEHLNKMYRQTELARMFSKISPGAVYTYATDTLARTGLSSYYRFMRFIKRHRERFEDWNRLYHKNAKNAIREVAEYAHFHIPKESIIESIQSALTDILLLFLLNVLFFMGAHLSFLRYKV